MPAPHDTLARLLAVVGAGVRFSMAAGTTRVRVSATGAAMFLAAPFSADASFAQDPDVVVQLVNDEGRCWSSSFTSANGARLDPEFFQDSEP